MPSGTGQSPSTTLPSRSIRMTWDGRSSAQVSSQGLHKQRSVTEVDGDVAREVVAVSLAPQRACEYDQLLCRRQVRDQLVSAVGVKFIGFS